LGALVVVELIPKRQPVPFLYTNALTTHVKLLGCAAQSGVVLLDEVPSDLILGDLGLRSSGGGGVGGGSGCLVVVLRGVCVVGLLLVETVLGRVAAVGHR
jgi:hypothetical protein